MQSCFQGIDSKPRRLPALPRTWTRWSTADREPIARWTCGRATLLGDAAHPFALYERSRVLLSAREMGRIYHAKGVERLVRNDLWRDRAPERYYDPLDWLYDWRVDHCLAVERASF